LKASCAISKLIGDKKNFFQSFFLGPLKKHY
jgi:hypothetical protein